MKLSAKSTLFFLILFSSFLGCAKESNYSLEERKVIESPYISEDIELGKEFDLFITRGSSVYLGGRKNKLSLELEKMVIMCVSQKDECIGDQFFFHFKASREGKSKKFVLIKNEHQNTDLDDNDVQEKSEEIIFGYTISLLDLNFSIGKNSIQMMISK